MRKQKVEGVRVFARDHKKLELPSPEVELKHLKTAALKSGIGLSSPLTRFRIALQHKFGDMYLRGTSTKFRSESSRPGGSVHAYFIPSVRVANPVEWMGLLRSTFYAAFDRAFQHSGINNYVLGGKVPSQIVLKLYSDRSTLLEKLFVPREPHTQLRAQYEQASSYGEVRPTFIESYLPNGWFRVFNVYNFSREWRLAEQKASYLINRNPALKQARERLQFVIEKGEEAEFIRRALEEPNSELIGQKDERKKRIALGKARYKRYKLREAEVGIAGKVKYDLEQEYLAEISNVLGYKVVSTLETSSIKNNPELYLVTELMKHRMYSRFIQALLSVTKDEREVLAGLAK